MSLRRIALKLGRNTGKTVSWTVMQRLGGTGVGEPLISEYWKVGGSLY